MRAAAALLLTLVAGCGSSIGTPDGGRPGAGDTGAVDASAPDAAMLDGGVSPADGAAAPDTGPGDDRAWLHADVWSVFWNDRTRCGAEYAFLHMCRSRGGDCSLYEAAVAACDPERIIYGQVGPEKQAEPLCQRGRYPDIGGCDARLFDFERLRFWWYGAEWEGNWPFATLKVFPGGTHDPAALAGDALVAVSNLPGRGQAAMAGIDNHGLDRDGDGTPDSSPCAMLGVTSGDAAYRSPFGGFAWIEVPTDRDVTVVAAAGTNFADRSFAGCSRGDPTQDPWVRDAPGAVLGCVYIVDFRFEAGKHYVFRYGEIHELPEPGPPPEIVAGFALPEVGLDVSTPAACAR